MWTHGTLPLVLPFFVALTCVATLSSTVVVRGFSTRDLVGTRTDKEFSSYSFTLRQRKCYTLKSTRISFPLFSGRFLSYESSDSNDEEEECDEYIDTDSLGDWRNFRRSLSLQLEDHDDDDDDPIHIDDDNNFTNSTTTPMSKEDIDFDHSNGELRSSTTRQYNSRRKNLSVKSVSKDNEEILRSQNKDLAEEYLTGVWAHETAMVRDRGAPFPV
jgi:hypothetical protein